MKSGLKNLGNTCFMNAALQCLIHSPEFITELIQLPLHEKKQDYPITYGVCKFVAKMSTEEGLTVNPNEIKHLVSKYFKYITDGSQHDSHEFFLLLLQLLEEEQNRALGAEIGSFSTDVVLPPSSYDFVFSDPELIQLILSKANDWWSVYRAHNPNPITNVFYGEQIASIRCTNCSNQSCVLSSFNSLYLSIPRKQYEITVNVIIENLQQTSSYTNPITFKVFPVRCVFDDNSLLSQLEDQVLSQLVYEDEKVAGSLIFLLGKYEKNAGSILYTYINKHTPVVVFQKLPPKSTIVAYYVPYRISREDYHSFVIVNQVSLLYLANCNLFHMNNACIPFCMVIHPKETTRSLFTRIRYLLRSLYTIPNTANQISTSAKSPTMEPISISIQSLKGSIFYYPTDIFDDEEYEVDSLCFPFLRVLGRNTISIRDFDTVPRLSLSSCSIPGHEESFAFDCLESFSSLIDNSNGRTAFSISSIFRISKPETVPGNLVETVRTYFDESQSRDIITKISNQCINELKVVKFEMHGDRMISLHDCYSFSSIVDMTTPCEHCHLQCKQEIQQRFAILPPVLVVVLKRFDFNINNGFGMYTYSSQSKISDFVHFPLEGFDLSSYVLNDIPAVYDLICVCNHTGTSYFGHYYAYCRTLVNDSFQWMEFNDSVTRMISPSQIITSNAYLLFYHRRDIPISFHSTKEFRSMITKAIPDFADYCEPTPSILRRSSIQFKDMIHGFNTIRKSHSSSSLQNDAQVGCRHIKNASSSPSLNVGQEMKVIEIKSPSPVVSEDSYACNKKEQERRDFEAALSLDYQLQKESNSFIYL